VTCKDRVLGWTLDFANYNFTVMLLPIHTVCSSLYTHWVLSVCCHHFTGTGFLWWTFPFRGSRNVPLSQPQQLLAHSLLTGSILLAPLVPLCFLSAALSSNWNWNCQITDRLLKFKLYCDWRSVGQFILVLAPILFSLFDNYFLSSCGVPSLTRGQVCNLQCSHSLVTVTQDP
jgi:hypothetical protein